MARFTASVDDGALPAVRDRFERGGGEGESSLNTLLHSEDCADLKDKIDVPPERRFVGWDGYKGVIESCDVVLLATSPHFRPLHLAAAVAAGRHTFVEKPIATDAPGVRSVQASCELARQKGLSIVSGLCYRYEHKKRETIQRIHDGALGEIVAMHTTYNAGALWHRGRKPEWSEMEYQMRNWAIAPGCRPRLPCPLSCSSHR